MNRVLDVVAPPRFGRSFRWLLASTWVSNLGDGVAIAAGPLLIASQTDSKFLVALGALVQWLPPLVFGLLAGALTDRLNRLLIVLVMDAVRIVVLAGIALTIVTGTVSIAVLLVALFLLGAAEAFADNASLTFLPMLVHRDDLALGNSRLQIGVVTLNQLAGAPLGALMFAAGRAWPFVGDAVVVLMAALLISRVSLPPHGRSPEHTATLGQDVVEGFRWVVHHAAVRTLVLTIFIFNITFGAAWSVLVLYATQRLHLGAVGFGLITTVGALGGLLGSLTYGWITRHVSLADLMRIGLIVETFTHLVLAVTTVAWVALIVFFVFGAHAFVWGTTSGAVRQRAVPRELQGRVGAVNVMGVYGGLVAGSAIGGVLAERYGVTAPFWFAFVGSGLFVVAIWRQLSHIAHADSHAEPVAGV